MRHAEEAGLLRLGGTGLGIEQLVECGLEHGAGGGLIGSGFAQLAADLVGVDVVRHDRSSSLTRAQRTG